MERLRVVMRWLSGGLRAVLIEGTVFGLLAFVVDRQAAMLGFG